MLRVKFQRVWLIQRGQASRQIQPEDGCIQLVENKIKFAEVDLR